MWRRTPSARRPPSGSSGQRQRLSARGGARHVGGGRPNPSTRHPQTKRRATAPILRGLSCRHTPKAGTPVAMPTPVSMERIRACEPVPCRMPRTTHSRRNPWRKRRSRRWSRRVGSGHQTTQVPLPPSRRRGTMGLTVRPRPRPWSPWGAIPPSPPRVCGTIRRRQQERSRRARRKNAWQRRGGHQKVVRGSASARPWWHRCLARAKPGAGFVGSCGEA